MVKQTYLKMFYYIVKDEDKTNLSRISLILNINFTAMLLLLSHFSHVQLCAHETSLVLSAIKSLLSVGILLPGFGCVRLIGLADEQKEYRVC